MSTPLHPSELRSRVFCALANGMSPSVIAEMLQTPLEQVEPLIAEYHAERRERMLARFQKAPTPIVVDASKPVPQLVIPVVEVPTPPSDLELRIEKRGRQRTARRAEKQAAADAARADAEARR